MTPNPKICYDRLYTDERMGSMELNIGDFITTKDVSGEEISGQITKINVNTVILHTKSESYVVRLKTLKEQGYITNEITSKTNFY